MFIKIYLYKVFFEHVINKLSTLFQHYFNNYNINVILINFQYCFNIISTLFQQLQYKYVINKLLTLFKHYFDIISTSFQHLFNIVSTLFQQLRYEHIRRYSEILEDTLKLFIIYIYIFIILSKSFVYFQDILRETRDLEMKHVNIIDFMLKSTFCQLFIDGPLTVHLKECYIIIHLYLVNICLIDNSQIIY